jgi:hypothetical protein
MADGSPTLKKEGLRFFGRKTDSPSGAAANRKVPRDQPATPEKEKRGDNSPRLNYGPTVKLSDVSQLEFTPNAALSNFRARKKTISEYLAPLTGFFGPRRVSTLERLSNRPSPTKMVAAEDERRRVMG